jgi:hypothetical protein
MWTPARILVSQFPVFLAFLTVARPTAAQETRVITGTLRNASDSTLLADVLVKLIDPRVPRLTSTDGAGTFTLRVPAGPARLLAVRIGFLPETLIVRADQAALTASMRPTVVVLDPMTVTGRFDNLQGISATASEGRVGAAELRRRPISREGELLETVPGVIVTQHSGDGKANQYFVRGFNLDHGTDFQTRIEGMPLNLPTNAHGQGYTDLNLLIPELVEHLEYRLGVYHADMGDFGSAGGAEFRLVSRLDRPFARFTAGKHGLARLVAAASRHGGRGDFLVGGELKAYDGPWEIDQRARKLSGVARYSWGRGPSRFSILGMAYRNTWNASDQIPVRAVEAGLISRFGQIDSTDGGETERYSLSGSWRRAGGGSAQEVQVFGVYSRLDLFSNFGFFLSDPIRGDQFNQREGRVVLGANARHSQQVSALGQSHVVRVGVQTRADLIHGLGLHRTVARFRVGTVRQDNVREWGSGAWLEAESRWRPWLRSVVGTRADGYFFKVRSDRAGNSGSRRAGIVSPKASLVLAPSTEVEFYLSAGLGFHSNDARGTTITIDPVSGGSAARVDPLVRSRGAEVGLRISPLPGWRSTLVLWALDLDSELLFIGDGGSTEPSDASRRRGVTWTGYYRPIPPLALDLDVSFSRARLARAPGNGNRIPGALESVVAAGIGWNALDRGPFGSLRLRHFGSYPLIEDNSVRARSATLVNAEAGYLFTGIRLQAEVLNLLDSRAYDIQYYYRSRLQGEPAAGVDDVHFHPVEPRQVRVSLSWGL